MHTSKRFNSGVSLLFMNLINYDGQINFFFLYVGASEKQYHDTEGLEFNS